jgi:hypothetical protein
LRLRSSSWKREKALTLSNSTSPTPTTETQRASSSRRLGP